MIYKQDYFGYVYEWTNIKNGKKYIGSHFGAVNDNYIGSGTLFKREYKKYPDNFTMIVLEYITVDDRNLTFKCEQKWLDTIPDIQNNKLYYNMNNNAVGGWIFIKNDHITKRSNTLKTNHSLHGLSQKERDSYSIKIQSRLDRIANSGFTVNEQQQHAKYGYTIEVTDLDGNVTTYSSCKKATKELGIDIEYGRKVCLTKPMFKGYIIKTVSNPVIDCNKKWK